MTDLLTWKAQIYKKNPSGSRLHRSLYAGFDLNATTRTNKYINHSLILVMNISDGDKIAINTLLKITVNQALNIENEHRIEIREL